MRRFLPRLRCFQCLEPCLDEVPPPEINIDRAQLDEEKNLWGEALITPAANFDHAKLEKEDLEATDEHLIFNWLDWAPEPSSICYQALHKHFPGALPGEAVNNRIKSLLRGKEFGFNKANTLLGFSLCPDEINHEPGCLVDLMKQEWGRMFPLGGISGAPFVGVTGFGAFSHHVPDDGNIIIVYGPHVAVSAEGLVGKTLREGQHHLSTACGAVIGAYNACSAARNNNTETDTEYNPCDMQMGWIKSQIEAHLDLVSAQPNPMAALAYQAYEMVKAKLEKIVNLEFGSGKLVLIGGIQINMPTPWRDHFLPLTFEVHQKGRRTKDLLDAFECKLITELPEARRLMRMIQPDARKAITPDAKRAPAPASKAPARKGSFVCEANFDHTAEKVHDEEAVNQHLVWSWLTWSPEIFSPCYNALHKEFPGALPGPGVHHRVMMTLTRDYGFTPDNTLFGNSICSDEINNTPQSLSALMACYWGAVFPMGGLGGVPFAGKTGFKAFSAHVPDNGNIVILYGPHVGVSEFGEVGKILRKGQDHDSTACGAVIGAYHASCAQKSKEDVEFDETDMQMGWIKHQIQAHSESISKQECPLAALAYQAFELVKNKINKVVDTNFGSGRLVLIGGIQINLTPPYNDHFLPLSFEVRQAGKPTENIIKAFDIPMPQVATEWVEI
mmetsp:Transcript_96652/g.177690  ORF Transcript_96652/g.177690 Transcript_96652/m.177690 type:complete len:671 (+) Transcript_96652:133-2145(+)